MRSIELFTGCGGLAYGLSRSGFKHELMAEWDKDAVETVLHNRERKVKHVQHWPIRHTDVRAIQWSDFFSHDLSLVAGGPPCQPFSIGGKHKGNHDARDMWPEAIRAVRESNPKAFIFENVKGITREAFADYLQWIVNHLKHPALVRGGDESIADHLTRLTKTRRLPQYEIMVVPVNAADFGAPQKRSRVLIIGFRADLAIATDTIKPTHSRERLLWDQWISGRYWKRHGIDQPAEIPAIDRSTVRLLQAKNSIPDGKPWVTVRDALLGLGDPNGELNHVYQPGAKVYPGHTGSPLDQPAKALKAGGHGVPGGENMMVCDDGGVRYFTVREAARLQGLPDAYQFPRSWSESMRQLGNAVPTQLAEAVGRWIAKKLVTG